jgi:hypothetical protein
MENNKNLDPTSTVDMIKVLQSRFKDRVPRKNVSYEEVLKMQGQQQVIDYIIGTLQELERKQAIAEMEYRLKA